MVEFQIENKDQHIWNKDHVFKNLLDYFQQPIIQYTINTAGEGPCLQSSGIEELVLDAAQFQNVELDSILIRNGNLLKSSKIIKEQTINYLAELFQYQKFCETKSNSKNIIKHFGHFIGRSNYHRLWIASYLFKNYKDITLQTFHWHLNNNYHKEHLDLENLLNIYQDYQVVKDALDFLQNCPIILDYQEVYPIVQTHNHLIRDSYKNIFVDIVCESYWSGNVFFLTEKTWRPIEQLTPFIVQGPQGFLKNLQQLGFITFENWWSEKYDDYSFYCKPFEICKLIEQISSWSTDYCTKIYKEMLPILEHNKKVLSKLTWAQVQNTKFYNTESNEP